VSAVVDLRLDGGGGIEGAEAGVRKRNFLSPFRPRQSLTQRALIARSAGVTLLTVLLLIGPNGLKWAGPANALCLGLIYAMVVLAVSVLGWIGEISLAVVAQMGFGLIATSILQTNGVPFVLVLPLVALSSVPVSLIIGMFALRLRGVNFVVASLAFGYMAQRVIFDDYMGAGANEQGRISRPDFLINNDARLYYVILAALVIVAGTSYAVRRSRLGIAITAMRDSETAFWTLGHSPAAYKLFVVCLSGAIATLAGCFYALLQLNIPAIYYQPGLAILFFGFALAGGMGSIGGALGAGILFGALPKYLETLTEGRFTKFDFFFYGVTSLLLIVKVPGGLGALGKRLWTRAEGQA
jgi:branched-chain amino acid transport system permease protein